MLVYKHRTSVPTPQPTRPLAVIAIAALLSAAIRGYHDNLRLGSLLVDPYWVGFYVTNYQDGFRRRALIGTLARTVAPHGLPVVLINALALLALAAVLTLFVRAFLRLAAPPSLRTSIFTFALFASAIASIYIECLGDTLQIAFLLFLAIALLPIPRLRAPLAFAALLLAFFVHEASAFLLAPVIPFLLRPHPRLRDFALPAAALVALVGLSVHWSTLDTHLTYHALSIPRGLPLEDLAETPGFFILLRKEIAIDFGSRALFTFFLIKCLSIAGLAFAAVIALASTLPPAPLRRTLHAFAAILLFSAPLWIIAHDWGRFLGYTVFLAVLAAAFHPESVTTVPIPNSLRLIPRLAATDAIACAALLLLLASPYYQSRIFGMHIRDLIASLPILLAGLLFARRTYSQPQS